VADAPRQTQRPLEANRRAAGRRRGRPGCHRQRGLDRRQQPRQGAIAHIPPEQRASGRHAALAGSPLYHHALTAGVQAALTIGAAATVLALLVTLVAIRVRREELPDSQPLA
jgi:hypothetical protein